MISFCCVCVYVYHKYIPRKKRLNACTDLHKTWYVYHFKT
jgi:hypothetical protein